MSGELSGGQDPIALFDAPASWARTQGGRVVHQASCRHAQRDGAAWAWAAGKTIDQVDRELRELGVGYRCCRTCLPGTGWVGAPPTRRPWEAP